MSAYYSSLVSCQELEWWLAHNPCSAFPLVTPVADSGADQQDAIYHHCAIIPPPPPAAFSYPSPDRTPPMQFISAPAWTINIPATAGAVPLVTPIHGKPKRASKSKHCNGTPKKKRYQCSYCAKDFSRDADRKRHEDCVHFGIRGFHCPHFGCLSKGFVRSYDLGRHMKSCRFRQ